MKIAFRLDAGHSTGMGHAVRCAALAEEFIKRGGECFFYGRENDGIKNFAKNSNINFIPVPNLNIDDECQWLNEATEYFDILILDSYNLNDKYIDSLNDKNRFLICYDDNALYTYSCDAVINANLHAKTLTYRLGLRRPHLLLGGFYASIRGMFVNAPVLTVNKIAKKVFMCFGGSDSRNFTPLALSWIQDITGIEIITVIGAMAECEREILEISKSNVTVIKNPENMADIMSSCDIGIISGGSISLEAAALGLPSIIIEQAENQKQMAEFMGKSNMMEYLGSYENVRQEKLENSVLSLIQDYDRRLLEHDLLIKSVSKNGAANIVNYILGRK